MSRHAAVESNRLTDVYAAARGSVGRSAFRDGVVVESYGKARNSILAARERERERERKKEKESALREVRKDEGYMNGVCCDSSCAKRRSCCIASSELFLTERETNANENGTRNHSRGICT